MCFGIERGFEGKEGWRETVGVLGLACLNRGKLC